MAGSIFDAYDEEYLALTQDISNNISHITTYETDAGMRLSGTVALLTCSSIGVLYCFLTWARILSLALPPFATLECLGSLM